MHLLSFDFWFCPRCLIIFSFFLAFKIERKSTENCHRMTFDRVMMIFFAIATTILLVFQKDPEIHHHFYGSIGDGDVGVGQAHHHYSKSQSHLRPTEEWTPTIEEPPMITEPYFPNPAVDPSVSYEDYDFVELPFEIRNAAHNLGYTAEIWNYGEEDPPVFSKSWFQLTREEQNAAEMLGFLEELWESTEQEHASSSSTSPPEEGESEDFDSSSSNSESEDSHGHEWRD